MTQPFDDRHESYSARPAHADQAAVQQEIWEQEAASAPAPAVVFLSRDAILDAEDLEVRDVHVPEWGGTVRVQALTGAQRARINATSVVSKGQSVELKVEALTDLQLRMVGASLVDRNGDRLFADHDIVALGRKNAGVIERLYNIVTDMSGLNPNKAEATRGN